MAIIHITLLGDCDVRIGNDSHTHFRLKKSKILLAYLALQQGHPTSREKLAHLLWSDRDNKQARASLRQALSELRTTLGQLQPSPLITNNIDVALDPSVTEIDACRFVHLSRKNDEASLQVAADLYKGPIFDGVDAGCPAFEEWIDQERRDYHERALRTLTKLLAFDFSGNRNATQIGIAQKLLRLDPLHEATYRTIMKLHAAAGQSSKALRQYDRCQKLLNRELDVEPEPETIALADQIRSDRLSDISGVSENPLDKSDAQCGKITAAKSSPSHGSPTRFSSRLWPVVGDGKSVVIWATGLLIIFALAAYTMPVSREVLSAKLLLSGPNSKNQNVNSTAVMTPIQEKPEFSIVNAMAVQTDADLHSSGGKQLSSISLANIAYDEGVTLFRKQTPSDLLNAITSFKRALAHDPDYSQAEAALANTYLYGYVMHWPSVAGLSWAGDALETAIIHAQKSLQKEAPSALAYTVLAKAKFFGSIHPARYNDAVITARAAFVLDPNDPATYLGLGQIFIYGGEPERAIAHLELARKLDPANTGAAEYNLALAYFHMERFADAADHAERALKKSPDAYSVWALSATIFSYLNRQEEAILAINHARSLSRRQGVGPVTAVLTPGYMSYIRPMDRARLRYGLDAACFLIGVNLGE